MLVAAEGAAAVVLLVDAGLQEAKTGRLARKGQARVQRSPTVQVSVAEAAGAVEGVVGEAGKATLPADRGSMTGMMPLDGGMSRRSVTALAKATGVLKLRRSPMWKRQLACQRTRQLPQLKKLPLQLTSQRQSSLKQSLRDPRRLKGKR